MGEFNAGKWLLGLTMYFFVFFLVVTAINSGGSKISDDFISNSSVTGYAPPTINPFGLDAECTGILTTSFIKCVEPDYLDTNDTCSVIPNCTWVNGFFSPYCSGDIDLEAVGFVKEGWLWYGSSCEPLFNSSNENISDSSLCESFSDFGCEFVVYDNFGVQSINPLSSQSTGGIIKTIKYMFTFDADIGINSNYKYIFAFIFTWIPFFMLLWALYMALPFIH